MDGGFLNIKSRTGFCLNNRTSVPIITYTKKNKNRLDKYK